MSWRTINQILGLAAIDPTFWQMLREDPLATTQAMGFELTPRELEVFREYTSLSFTDLCKHVLERLAPDQQKE